jgi:hypothetical protein
MAGDDQVRIPLLGSRDDLLGRVTDSDVHRWFYARRVRTCAELAELGLVVTVCVLDDLFLVVVNRGAWGNSHVTLRQCRQHDQV